VNRTLRSLGTAAAVFVLLVLGYVVLGLIQGDGDASGSASSAPVASAPATLNVPSVSASPSRTPTAAPSTAFTADPTEPGGEPAGDPGRTGVDPYSGLRWISVDDLPDEAIDTLELIEEGGPFPYPGKDGSTFGNFEGLLPDERRGYYAEYTVETPGLSHRGARRIIAGDGGELYWTQDHYESFERIDR
jgi:ribonuclease T1